MEQWGETALHLAVEESHDEVVKLLVKYGAAVDIRYEVTNCCVTCGLGCGCGLITNRA